MLPRNTPIFVAGHRGLVGSAVMTRLSAAGYIRLLTADRTLDLRDETAVRRWFAIHRPAVVVLCAAKVGGILANAMQPARMLFDNLQIQASVIRAAHEYGTHRLVFLGSSCIYPRECPQPIREDYLLTGPLEPTNRAYAVAKLAGVEMCAALQQSGREYLALMPCNLYGPGDNYDLATSHVLPALIRRMHEARDYVRLWGTGTPRREFMYSDDLADAIVHLLDLPEWPSSPLNVGTGTDLTIRQLARRVAHVVGFRGRIEWDTSKPDGTPRKLLDVSRMTALGWTARTPLRVGLEQTYRAYLSARRPPACP